MVCLPTVLGTGGVRYALNPVSQALAVQLLIVRLQSGLESNEKLNVSGVPAVQVLLTVAVPRTWTRDVV